MLLQGWFLPHDACIVRRCDEQFPHYRGDWPPSQ